MKNKKLKTNEVNKMKKEQTILKLINQKVEQSHKELNKQIQRMKEYKQAEHNSLLMEIVKRDLREAENKFIVYMDLQMDIREEILKQ